MLSTKFINNLISKLVFLKFINISKNKGIHTWLFNCYRPRLTYIIGLNQKFIVNKYNRKFAPENVVLQIMIQTLKTISIIHSKGYLYRDFKPSNLMVKSPYDTIFIIDFGLSKKYINNGRHIPRRENKKLVGTPIFCSLNTHAGICSFYLIKSNQEEMIYNHGFGLPSFL